MTGAPNVLLFYDHLPNKRVTFYPNHEPAFCGCLGGGVGDDGDSNPAVESGVPAFAPEILEAAKSCVLERERAEEEAAAEGRMAALEEAVREAAATNRRLAEAVEALTHKMK